MMSIQFDFSQLQRAAEKVGARADQIPYALSLALNEAADVTRKVLITETWPRHVTVRNRSFMQASLTTRGARANKSMLSVEIYDRLNRGNLVMQEKGCVRQAKGGSMAIPITGVIKRGARGVPQSQRPKNLKGAFRKGDVILQRMGGKSKKVRVVYALKKTTRIPARVPFHRDFATSMERELRVAIPMAVKKAMATAR